MNIVSQPGSLFAGVSLIIGAVGDSAGDPRWERIVLIVQGVVALCFLLQVVASLSTAKTMLSSTLLILCLAAILAILVLAWLNGQWQLVLAEAATFLAASQLLIRQRGATSRLSGPTRPRLPVVAPHSADPKSGVMAAPSQAGTKAPMK